ncbi:MAG: MAPEG family protein [Steroidobacteraceae bacterium]
MPHYKTLPVMVLYGNVGQTIPESLSERPGCAPKRRAVGAAWSSGLHRMSGRSCSGAFYVERVNAGVAPAGLRESSMDQSHIFAPFFSMIALTLIVWVYMYARRIPFIQRGKFPPEQLTALEFTRISPPAVLNPSDNLKNLFEVPTVFYALVLYLYVTHEVDLTYLAASWIFVGFRVLHSIVHCTFNMVPLRFWLYAVSTVALWFIAIRSACHFFL